MKIDLGGGESKKYPDYIKVDLIEGDGISFGGINFNFDKLPFENNSIDDIICSHTLEHIENTKHFLNEIHRILKKDAPITFIVPYGLHPGSSKPVHKQSITECWFDFLRKKSSERIYGYKQWDIIGDMIFRKDKENRVYELEVKLTPAK